MLSYNKILPKKYIILGGTPFEVLSSHIFRKQQNKPVNQTKLRNLKNKKVTEKTFHQSDSVEEADLEKKDILYIYNSKEEYWFGDRDNPSSRFSITSDTVGPARVYLKEKEKVEALLFEGEVIGIFLPIKVDLTVIEAPPSIRGDTAQGGTKQVVLESGATVSVPLFISEGDIVRINTETGNYIERTEKNQQQFDK